MAVSATDTRASFAKGKTCSEWVEMYVSVTIGATGAVGATVIDAPITVTRASAGTYTLTYPYGYDAVVSPQVVSPASTINGANCTAVSGSAGTATVVTRNAAGAATDPANGDILQIWISVKAHA